MEGLSTFKGILKSLYILPGCNLEGRLFSQSLQVTCDVRDEKLCFFSLIPFRFSSRREAHVWRGEHNKLNVTTASHS